jgi:putative endonuclease
MASHLDLGKKGELLAQDYLLQQHYQLLHTNWRHGRREIDIIASQPGCLVFIEVKTLSSNLYGWPEQKVNAGKRRYLQAAAEAYIERMLQPPPAIRFDVIAITFQPDGKHELLHLEDAF